MFVALATALAGPSPSLCLVRTPNAFESNLDWRVRLADGSTHTLGKGDQVCVPVDETVEFQVTRAGVTETVRVPGSFASDSVVRARAVRGALRFERKRQAWWAPRNG